jgi:hypothetical protein
MILANHDEHAADVFKAASVALDTTRDLLEGLDLIEPSQATRQALIEVGFHLECASAAAGRARTLISADMDRQELRLTQGSAA